jgi:DNA-binding MarR family transcriptional regulator
MTTQNDTPLSLDDSAFRERYDPKDTLGLLLKQSYFLLQRAIDTQMVALDLTAMQWRPLMFLALGHGDTAAEIARVACTDTGAVTRMLDRLESKGLIRRVRSIEDRRVIKLELTEEGKLASRQIPALIQKVFDNHLAGFNEAEVDQFKDFFRRMIANGTVPPP